jgi:hypothetical protein
MDPNHHTGETQMAYYATTNAYADLMNGNRGFSNDYQFWKFETRKERDAFVETRWNKNAKTIKRREAEALFVNQYLAVGKKPPVGGLFSPECDHFSFED